MFGKIIFYNLSKCSNENISFFLINKNKFLYKRKHKWDMNKFITLTFQVINAIQIQLSNESSLYPFEVRATFSGVWPIAHSSFILNESVSSLGGDEEHSSIFLFVVVVVSL